MSNLQIDTRGIKRWFNEQGQCHRLDGPAVIYPDNISNGYQAWYQNDKYHREDGPARTWNDGLEEYWQNNKRHRLNGPFFIDRDGNKEYFINDFKYLEKDYWAKIKKMKHNQKCEICIKL